MRVLPSLLINAVLVFVVSVGAAFAEDTRSKHPLLSDRYMFTLGGFYSRNTTEASVAPSGGGAGRDIDFENTLDLDEQETTPTLGFIWRISERWRMDAEFFELKRDASRRLNADTQWGDDIYAAGTEVKSTFNVIDTRISAGYAFYRTSDKELGAGLGLHMFKLETKLSTGDLSARGREVSAPLPVINVFGSLALSESWAIRMRADWLSLDQGAIRDGSIDVHYQPWRNLGMGFGLRSLVIDLELDSSSWEGGALIGFQGPTAFLTLSF